eukprot:5028855-Lingulodinium_polyedra.AAC.1
MPPAAVTPSSEFYFCIDRGHCSVSGQKVMHAMCLADFVEACKTTHAELTDGSTPWAGSFRVGR